jgi:phosphoribosylformimino-5-aminoimidazole carboxamide ribotide isomerase
LHAKLPQPACDYQNPKFLNFLTLTWSTTHQTSTMTKFRPCIDLHAGHVKQIVGGTLTDGNESNLKTNYVSEKPASYYASLYKEHGLTGAHIIMLGPGNTQAAEEALAAWPDGLQVGGGVTASNAKSWVEKGAEKVC